MLRMKGRKSARTIQYPGEVKVSKKEPKKKDSMRVFIAQGTGQRDCGNNAP
jgi:hypothetical protein